MEQFWNTYSGKRCFDMSRKVMGYGEKYGEMPQNQTEEYGVKQGN